MTELWYWWSSLHQVEGWQFNARFLQHLPRALDLPMTPTTDSSDTIRSWLKTLKATLTKNLEIPIDARNG